jgi:thimet oligopeptidase
MQLRKGGAGRKISTARELHPIAWPLLNIFGGLFMATVFYRAHLIAILLFAPTVAAQELPKSQLPLWSTKPDVAAFERMENDRLATAQRAIDQLTAVKDSRTIENTLAPYDEAILQLNAASYFSGLMQQVHPDAEFRDHATAMTTKASSARTALSLNRDVYRALSSLDGSKADAATRYYVQRQLLEFRLAGVDKDDATRTQLKKLNDQLTEDQSMFNRNIADSTKIVELTDASELDGLPQDYIDKHKPGADGKIYITTEYPDFFPALIFAKSDGLRRRLYEAFWPRAYPKNRDVLRDMMRTRYEIATLIGYSSWADYNAADKMIKSGQNVAKFIQDLGTTTRPIAQREFAMLLAEKRKTDPGRLRSIIMN